MRIALTGATGYTGGKLLAALVARGDEVTALARPTSAEPRSGNARWVEGDLSDARALDLLVEGAEARLALGFDG